MGIIVDSEEDPSSEQRLDSFDEQPFLLDGIMA